MALAHPNDELNDSGRADEPIDAWPTGVDYCDAVGMAEVGLAPPHDRSTCPAGPLGGARGTHGRHAIVFRLDTGSRGPVALRCFTTPGSDLRQRYRAIGRYLDRYPVPVFPPISWLDDAVRVDGRTWPALEMEWVEGRRLDRWIDAQLHRPRWEAVTQLRAMASRWRRVALEVACAGVAHGDYQHGNVLIDERDRIRIVDLDGLWVPELADRPSPECGHEAYSHPRRSLERSWGPDMDAFSALVIWTSLRALASDPTLWELHDGRDEHLVLRADDLAEPRAEIWRRLSASADGEVRVLAERLRSYAAQPAASVPSVARVLAVPHPRSSTRARARCPEHRSCLALTPAATPTAAAVPPRWWAEFLAS